MSKFKFQNLIVYKFRQSKIAYWTTNNFVRIFFLFFLKKNLIIRLYYWKQNSHLRNFNYVHRFFSKIKRYVRKISFFQNLSSFSFWFENNFLSFLFIYDKTLIIFFVVFDAKKSIFFNSSKSIQKRLKRQKLIKFNFVCCFLIKRNSFACIWIYCQHSNNRQFNQNQICTKFVYFDS